jgi:coenzyme F420-0:L-glutamate ligase/coenzyme F420-1:gamma-L-glutamate ligase
MSIEIFPLPGLSEMRPGDDLAPLILRALEVAGLAVRDGDIFVVAQKIVSKAENRLVALDSITPSARAQAWAREFDKDARLIELVLSEAKHIVKMERGIIVAETQHGFVCANAGVDASNAPEGTAILLPEDPDRSAADLRSALSAALGVAVGVIVSDSFGRPWREGLVNVALGVAGLAPLADYRGTKDGGGKLLTATWIARADEIASAAELVMGKADGIPVAIVRGATLGKPGTGQELLRGRQNDLFR